MASPGAAQGNFGNYYQNMYLRTHSAMDFEKLAASGNGNRAATGRGLARVRLVTG